MRRRLDLAMTLVGDPRVIFLDEPTAGLDPRSRRTMWQIIGELVADGVTIFLTTQYLDEAGRLADRIAVLDHGRIVAEGTPAELKRRIPGGHVSWRSQPVSLFDRCDNGCGQGHKQRDSGNSERQAGEVDDPTGLAVHLPRGLGEIRCRGLQPVQ
jgi:ABC-2 type transport system ATP-binding protein